MNRREIVAKRRNLKEQNRQWPDVLWLVDRDLWPDDARAGKRISVMRSNKFLMQAFEERDGIVRLSFNRTEIDDFGGWRADISWDDLQDLKRQAGYGDRCAVEVYPADKDIVNVASMRHLWVFPEGAKPIGWKQ